MKKKSFYDEVEELLKKDKRFVSDKGELLRNVVYEAAQQMDTKLLKLLRGNAETRKRFFTDVGGVAVFDKQEFGWVVSCQNFLPDSYTRFRQKIGLAADGEMIESAGNVITSPGKVELVFPYKDCVLEGGQTKEDQKRNEIFYNMTLAPDEVDRLLAPKVFRNAIRFDSKGTESIDSFDIEKDNLIVKGNNMFVLASLIPPMVGSFNCIFADPPYYFKKTKADDAFKYNSNFKFSTWLSFCKTRFELAKELLSQTGFLIVTIGIDGYAALKLLLDEVFNVAKEPSNYVGTITWRKTDNQSNIGEFSNVVDYILIYRRSVKAHLRKLPLSDKAIKEYSYEDKHGKYRRANILDQTRGRYSYDIKTPDGTILHGPWMIDEDEYKQLLKNDGIHWPESGYQIPYGKTYLEDAKRNGQITSDFWDGSYGTNQRGADEIKQLFGNRAFPFAKPELLMMNILSLATDEGDRVLDFCIGSGTTVAVAQKMGRRFVGIDQMDYIWDLAVKRLEKVIKGEACGISKVVNWRGGGSFIYCELAKSNQLFVERIEVAKKDSELVRIWDEMLETGFISCKIDPAKFSMDDEDFKDLSLADKKRILMDLLDMNQLYVNYCDIDDKTFKVSAADKAFTRSFYGDK